MTQLIDDREIDSTLAESFEPTPHQIVWVDTAVKLGTLSPVEISKECGVDRSNWGRNKWLGLEGFYDWFVTEWRRRRAHLIPELDAIGMKYSRRGSYKHWEGMNKKVGELADVPEGGSQTNIQVNLGKEALEDAEEFIKWRDEKRRKDLEK